MDKTVLLAVGILVLSTLGESATTTAGPFTEPAQTTADPSATTAAESVRDFIKRVIINAIRETLGSAVPPAEQTPAEGTGTQQSTPTASAVCPEGQYDRFKDTVTFTLESRNCKITVYMSKILQGTSRGSDGRGGNDGEGGRDGEGERRRFRFGNPVRDTVRYIDGKVAVAPIAGSGTDQCPDVTVTPQGRDGLFVETTECVFYVGKDKTRGRTRSYKPTIISRAV